MSINNQFYLHIFAVTLLATGITISVAHADDDRDQRYINKPGEHSGEGYSREYGGENRGKPIQPAQTNAMFQQECSSCHIAYSPGLLPAESWRKIMSGLNKHFGSDASLDIQDRNEVTDFLVINSSNRWSASTAPLRITESSWFRSKHDSHEVSPTIWKSPQVKSPANCASCHRAAERGDFSKRNIQMPL
jgi:hypothetical protein